MQSRGFSRIHAALVSLLGLAGTLTSGSAAAQTTPAPAPGAAPAPPASTPEPNIELVTKRPKMDLTTPPPAPPEGRTYHEHDGFSVRTDVGIGVLLHGGASVDGAADVKTTGLTFDYDLMIGGAPSPGFTLGGGIAGSLQLSGDWKVGDDFNVGSGNLNTFVLGPFAEGYPDSHGGLHFGALVGLARLTADASVADSGVSTLGIGGAFWAGSSTWVAPDWSVGGHLRLEAATAKGDNTTLTSVALSIMFSVLYQ